MDNNKIILNEAVQDTNLRDLFDEINRKYFNNILDSNITIKWSNSRAIDGHAKYKYSTREIIIYISKFFNYTPNELIDLMAHEMIHVLMYQQGKFKEDHGREFHKWMDILNSKGLNITVVRDYKLNMNPDIDHSRKIIWSILVQFDLAGYFGTGISVYVGAKLPSGMDEVLSRMINNPKVKYFIIGKNTDVSLLEYRPFKTSNNAFRRIYKIDMKKFLDLRDLTLVRPEYYEYGDFER